MNEQTKPEILTVLTNGLAAMDQQGIKHYELQREELRELVREWSRDKLQIKSLVARVKNIEHKETVLESREQLERQVFDRTESLQHQLSQRLRFDDHLVKQLEDASRALNRLATAITVGAMSQEKINKGNGAIVRPGEE